MSIGASLGARPRRDAQRSPWPRGTWNGPRNRWSEDRSRVTVGSYALGLNRHLVDLLRGVSGLLVDPKDGRGIRALREAEDLARGRVGPRLLEVHSLRALDIEVGLVRGGERFARNPFHASVNIHELGHDAPSLRRIEARLSSVGGGLFFARPETGTLTGTLSSAVRTCILPHLHPPAEAAERAGE